nr:glutathione s-transferase 3 [Quercus suber]
MGLTVHHLQISQSERIVWLCEALGIEYELKLYQRHPLLSPPEYSALHPIGAAPVITDGDRFFFFVQRTYIVKLLPRSERIVWLCEALGIEYELKLYQRHPLLSPPEYSALHPIGAAPVITDGEITIAESEACIEYIINVYGGGKLTVQPGESNYAESLYWYHFINGTLQPALGRVMALRSCQVPDSNPTRARYEGKIKQCFEFIDKRLGEVPYLAGSELTKADIMAVFSLSTMRKFFVLDETPYQNIQAYLQRLTKLESYQRAMKRGDPDLEISELISAKGPELVGPLKSGGSISR